MPDSQNQPRRRYFAGVLALLAVVLIWVGSSFVMNSIFADLKYNKPFLITYINTATFSLYLLPLLFASKKNSSKEFPSEDVIMETEARLLGEEDIENPDMTIPDSTDTSKLSTMETVKLSFTFCFLWFFANYTTNASLAYTNVASSTIISSMSGLFTLGIGALFGVEKLSILKIVSVSLSFGGVVIVSYSDQLSKPDSNGFAIPAPLIGDLLALCGAFFYGCYTTILKLKIVDESRIDMPLFFGFVGAFNVLLMWPFFPILHYIGLEEFQLPYSISIWMMILLNAFIGTFLSDYLWLLSMLMTSPLVVTLGISLTIPLALVGDVVFKHFMPGLQYAIGATLVVVGFLIVNMATLSDVDEKVSVRQRELVDDVEGEDDFDTEDNFRRMARALSISESNRNRRESNASVLSEHP
ncbi:hypothetical protein INT48_008334 [Thamnidium elegans]|uniref:EamA domain-containing protein n=1 Tax=Thamnidium elegans TaxID=101142 RepID=A0A8H7SY34_9FUNG|nr:hypothetical protein INT48_008334 [Thamnidium elegans]